MNKRCCNVIIIYIHVFVTKLIVIHGKFVKDYANRKPIFLKIY